MGGTLQTLVRIRGGAKRLADVAAILAKYGLAEWLKESNGGWIAKRLRGGDGARLNERTTEERVRLALSELGTTGVKLGQMLSTRPDMLGQKLTRELSKLQRETTPDSPEQVAETIRGELGAPPEELFAEFDPEPIASASIGQVHRAVLPTGEQVVVKVMHEGIESSVRRDLGIMTFLADLMEKHAPALRQYQPVATAKHFRQTLLRELDFGYEGRYLEEFGANFRDDATVRFPALFSDFSSRRVLTMEFLDGVLVSDREQLLASGADLTEFARRGANVYLEMIFRDGIYHADPHPGNIMLLPGDVVGVLDCGMVGRIDDVLRGEIESMLLAVVAPDSGELVEIVCRVGAVPPELDRDALRSELSELIAEYSNQPIDRFDLAGALARVIDIIRSYHIVLPEGFALLLKTVVMLEGTGRQSNPNFSLAELLEPFCKTAVQRRLDPRRMLRDLTHSYRDWRRLFAALPKDLGDILSRIRTENIEVHLEHRRLEGTVDRLVQGIIVAALFVGSALILSSAVPPIFGGVSVIGALGCAASVLLGVRLLRAIRKSANQMRNGGR